MWHGLGPTEPREVHRLEDGRFIVWYGAFCGMGAYTEEEADRNTREVVKGTQMRCDRINKESMGITEYLYGAGKVPS